MPNPAKAMLHVLIVVVVALLVVVGVLIVVATQIAEVVRFFLGVILGVPV